MTLDELVVRDDEPAPAAPIPTVSLDELLAREAAAKAATVVEARAPEQVAPTPTSHPAEAMGHNVPVTAVAVAPKTPKPVELAPRPAKEAVKAPAPAKAAVTAPAPAKAVVTAPAPAKAVVTAPEPVQAVAKAPAPAKAPEPVQAVAKAPEPTKAAAKAPEPASKPVAGGQVPDAAPAKPAGRLSDAALDAYDEARTLHRSDPQRALALYAEAARHGNVVAWRQIGTLQAQLGDNAAAIAALKRYRAAAPGSRDSQMVADVIRRLGGSPE